MTMLFIYAISVLLCSVSSETLDYTVRLPYNEDNDLSSIKVEANSQTATLIKIADGKNSKGGETIIDHQSKQSAIRTEEKCLVFPMKETHSSEMLKKIVSSYMDDSNKHLREFVIISHDVHEMVPYSETILKFCEGRKTENVLAVTNASDVARRLGVELCNCQFSGFIDLQGKGVLACFPIIKNKSEDYSMFRLRGYDDLVGLQVKVNETSPLTTQTALVWILMDPKKLYEFGSEENKLCNMDKYVGALMDHVGSNINLQTEEMMMFFYNSDKKDDFKLVPYPDKNELLNMSCDFQNILQSSQTCGVKTAFMVQNCRITDPLSIKEDCAFVGPITDPENHIQIACIRKANVKLTDHSTFFSFGPKPIHVHKKPLNFRSIPNIF